MTKTTHASEGDRHSSDVNTVIVHQGKIYSGADDGKIKVWDENMKLLDQIENAHTRSVFALAAGGDTLYSGSNDGTLKSWNLSDLKAKSTLSTGNREIWRLCLDGDTLYAGDSKGNVEVYSKDKLANSINLIEPIRDMMVIGNLLYTLQELDLVVRLIKSQYGDFERRKTIMGGVPMCVAGDKMFFCSRNGQDIHLRENSLELNFMDIALFQETHDQRIHSLVGMVKGNETFLYSGGGDKVVKQWKIEGNKCLNKISHCPLKAGINVMAAGPKGEIYVGCRDGYLFRLDF